MCKKSLKLVIIIGGGQKRGRKRKNVHEKATYACWKIGEYKRLGKTGSSFDRME